MKSARYFNGLAMSLEGLQSRIATMSASELGDVIEFAMSALSETEDALALINAMPGDDNPAARIELFNAVNRARTAALSVVKAANEQLEVLAKGGDKEAAEILGKMKDLLGELGKTGGPIVEEFPGQPPREERI